MYFENRHRIAVWFSSLSVTTGLFIVILLRGIYIPAAPYMIPLSQNVNNVLAVGIVIGLAFPAFVEYNNSRWLRAVDTNIPRLLRDITEGIGSGVPLIKTLEQASTRDYGPLSKPLSVAMVRFKLTSDLAGAMNWLGEKLVRPAAKRMSTILVEAAGTGGQIMDVLDRSVEVFTQLANFQEERESQTKPYILMAYVGTIVFLAVSWVILVRFLGPLAVNLSDPSIGKGTLQSILDINYYKSILFWAAAMEAIFGGLIGGKISEGRVTAGLMHSVILLIMTIVAFNLFSV